MELVFCQLLQHHLLKRWHSLCCITFTPLSKTCVIYFWVFCSVLLICVPTYFCQWYLPCYCSHIASFKIRWIHPSLFLKTIVSGIIVPLTLHIHFRISLPISTKYLAGIVIQVVLTYRPIWGEVTSFLGWIFQSMNMICLSI